MRIAVALLGASAGWALQTYAGWSNALLFGLLIGLIAARFVPGSSCAVPRRDATAAHDRSA